MINEKNTWQEGNSMQNEKPQTAIVDEEVLQQIKNQIEQIQYGSVTIVIHDSKVVQLDTSEKIRLA
jgi:hypothetical protein